MRKIIAVFCSSLISLFIVAFPTLALANTVIGSDVTATTTWSPSGGVYIVSGEIAINAGVTLTIDPNTIVKFNNAGSGLIVNGTLSAVATSGSPIYFTSYKDDSVGGDTNNNGAANSPAAGDWDVIKINTGGAASLGYTIVRYGGASGSVPTSFYNSGGRLTIASSTLSSGVAYGVYHSSGTTTVASSTVSDAGFGIYGGGTGELTFVNSLFVNNSYATALNITSLTGINYGNTATGTGVTGTALSGTISSARTVYGDTMPYVFDSTITINGGTLTIQPGAILKAKGAAVQMYVQSGELYAVGTLNSPIYFTSYKDDSIGGDTNHDGSATSPALGDWDTIKTDSNATTTLGYALVRYAGNSANSGTGIYNAGGNVTFASSTLSSSGNSYGIYYTGASKTTIASSTISSSGNYGIFGGGTGLLSISDSQFVSNPIAAFVDLSSGVTLRNSGNTSTGTGVNGMQVYGPIYTNRTWDAGLPYVVSTALSVEAGVTLTINPGAVVKFNGATAGIAVSGMLVAEGHTVDTYKIYFTGYKDDAVGGDTNGNGSANSPAGSDWGNIKVNSGGSASLKSAVVRYAGNGGYSVWNNGADITMLNSEVATGSTYGIYESSGSMTIIASNIHDHSVGVQVGGTATIGSSWIHDNSTYGLYNSTAATSSVDAIYNYWGDASGPYHAIYNASGTGDTVSNYVDFDPWLEEMHYLNVEDGIVRSSVDGNKDIDWGGSTAYTSAWYGAVILWNTQGDVTVATDTIFTIEDLTLDDVDEGADSFAAAYTFDPSGSDDLVFNDYWMQQFDSSMQLNAAAHELGHGLGLFHSYLNSTGNIMNSYVTSTTTLGVQDILDYEYLWQ